MMEQRQGLEWKYELSEKLEVKVGMHQGTVLLPFFAVVVDVVTEFVRSVLSELLYADDLLLMSETIEGLRNKFLEWK